MTLVGVGPFGDHRSVQKLAYAFSMILARRLRLDGALSGPVVPTVVNGQAVEAHLPRITTGFGVERSVPRAFQSLLASDHSLSAWGTAVVVQLDPWKICSFDAERLGVTVSGAGAEPASTWSGQELSMWFEQVADWIEVLTGQVNDPRARRTQQPVWGEGVTRWRLAGSDWHVEGARVLVDCSVPSSDPVWGRPAREEEFVSALERVAARCRPTSRDLLLRDARVHLLSGDSRRAALDAGLAAELMLAQACGSAVGAGKEWPRSYPPLAKATLGPLADAAPSLGVVLPPSFTKSEVNTRNAAAHGDEVMETDVKRRLDATVDLRFAIAPHWHMEFEALGLR